MARVAEKVAISVDAELLARAERLRKLTGESRSALVGRALRELLRAEERDRRVAEYVEAYRKVPEGSREVARVRKLSVRSLAALPWDDE